VLKQLAEGNRRVVKANALINHRLGVMGWEKAVMLLYSFNYIVTLYLFSYIVYIIGRVGRLFKHLFNSFLHPFST
jgi:hypothetical protein